MAQKEKCYKVKAISNVRVDGNIEYKSSCTIWVDCKIFLWKMTYKLGQNEK